MLHTLKHLKLKHIFLSGENNKFIHVFICLFCRNPAKAVDAFEEAEIHLAAHFKFNSQGILTDKQQGTDGLDHKD